MKKLFLIILLLLILLAVVICISCENKSNVNVSKNVEINFSEQKDIIARIILYRYVLSDLKMNPRQAKQFANIKFGTVNASRIDLDGDGQSEIIGVVYSSYYSCAEGYKLFILQKNNKVYKDISVINFLPNEKFVIESTRQNGYNTIKTNAYSNKCRLVNDYRIIPIYTYYNGKEYAYDYKKMSIENSYLNCSRNY